MKALVLLGLVIGTPPKLDALVAAAETKDPIELDRVARRLGAARLLHGLASGRPEVRRAVLEAAPRVDDSWTLLLPSARLIAAPDPRVAQAAALAARRIAAQLVSGRDDLSELPRDVPAEAVHVLVGVARTAGVPSARRLDALGVLTTLAPVFAAPSADVAPLLEDPAAELRRASVDLLALDPGATDLLARVVERDASPQVAGGAAAAVCRHLPRVATSAWVRLRTLALDARVDSADAIDVLACLAGGSTDDRAVVVKAARAHPTPAVRATAGGMARAAAAGSPAILRPARAPR